MKRHRELIAESEPIFKIANKLTMQPFGFYSSYLNLHSKVDETFLEREIVGIYKERILDLREEI